MSSNGKREFRDDDDVVIQSGEMSDELRGAVLNSLLEVARKELTEDVDAIAANLVRLSDSSDGYAEPTPAFMKSLVKVLESKGPELAAKLLALNKLGSVIDWVVRITCDYATSIADDADLAEINEILNPFEFCTTPGSRRAYMLFAATTVLRYAGETSGTSTKNVRDVNDALSVGRDARLFVLLTLCSIFAKYTGDHYRFCVDLADFRDNGPPSNARSTLVKVTTYYWGARHMSDDIASCILAPLFTKIYKDLKNSGTIKDEESTTRYEKFLAVVTP